jgi:glycosyltransferase involved in cell wall biosynthesis
VSNARIERHVITGEYPPQVGGVGDHTAALAAALVGCGERVHVWCPGTAGGFTADDVTVHRELGGIRSADLKRFSARLASMPAPRRLIVQWVPHAFGRKSLNVGFCRWIHRRRVTDGDEIDVIVHEPFLPFTGSAKASIAAVVHRIMIAYVLRAAARVWVVTPAWSGFLQPYAPARDLGFRWLPVPATIPVGEPAESLRGRLINRDALLIGSFATAGRYAEDALGRAVLPLLVVNRNLHLLLIGRHSDAFRRVLLGCEPAVSARVHATGSVPSGELAAWVSACDVGVQPYPDGVCGRQTTAMAFLAHGRPLVTTDGRFTEDVWRKGAVLLASTSAPDQLRAKLEALLTDRLQRDRLARLSCTLYESRFDVRHAAAALHDAIC